MNKDNCLCFVAGRDPDTLLVVFKVKPNVESSEIEEETRKIKTR